MKGTGGDAGTTVVELAFVVMIILMIGLGAVDLGLWMFQKSEATQAAREASRVAMIELPDTLGAQTSGAVFQASISELQAGLPDYSMTVTCADTSGVDIPNASDCVTGDLVTVKVEWHRDPLTFVGVTDTVSGASTRTVIGVP